MNVKSTGSQRLSARSRPQRKARKSTESVKSPTRLKDYVNLGDLSEVANMVEYQTTAMQNKIRLDDTEKLVGDNDDDGDDEKLEDTHDQFTELRSEFTFAGHSSPAIHNTRSRTTSLVQNNIDWQRRRSRTDFFNMDVSRGRRMQFELYKFNQRQKAIASKALTRSKKITEEPNESRTTENHQDFYLPLFEDKELLDPRQPWMLGIFDPDETRAYAFEQHLQTHLTQSTMRQKIALDSKIRFSLPMDLSRLEGLTPVAYLEQYCKLSEDQEFIYSKSFGALKADETISVSDLISSITEQLTGVFTTKQIEEFTYLTHLDKHESFSEAEFYGLSGLAERLYGIQNMQVPHPDLWLLLPGALEKADFHNLKQKIRHIAVDRRLRKLLYRIEQLSRINVDKLQVLQLTDN